MKISVIIPTYKPQAYLWECLEAIYCQSFPKADYEILLVLNGCNEPYYTQINEWLLNHKDLQVQFIQIDQGGVSNARNEALDRATGEFVTFIDDDDYVSSTYLSDLYAKASPEVVCLSNVFAFWDGKPGFIDYSLTKDYSKKSGQSTLSIFNVHKYFSGPCMKLIPMNCIQNRRYDIRFKNGEDTIFMFLISDKIHKVSFASHGCIYYRRYREGSAMTSSRSRWKIFKNSVNLIAAYTKIYLKAPLDYSFKLYIRNVMGAINTIIVGF